MTRKRRSFTPEFKQEAASLVLEQGYYRPSKYVAGRGRKRSEALGSTANGRA